jgi:hypothetical protein
MQWPLAAAKIFDRRMTDLGVQPRSTPVSE